MWRKPWTVQITPNDGYDDGNLLEDAITIDNQTPVIDSITITPNTAVYNTSEITCTLVATDPDGEILIPDYQWFIAGNLAGGSETLQLSPSLVSPSETVECVATVTDIAGVTLTDSTSITIENSPPTVDSLTLTPAEATPFTEVICAATASDSDGDPTALSFEFHNLTTGDSYSPSSSSTAEAALDLETITISPNDELQCVATVSDNQSQNIAETSIIIFWEAPVISSIEIQGGEYTSEILACSANAIDYQGNDISSSIQYQWINSSNNDAILASQSEYTIDPNETDVGDELSCIAMAVDQYGASTSQEDSVTVGNTQPLLPRYLRSLAILPRKMKFLSCTSAGEDIDLDNLQISYQWFNASYGVLLAESFQYTVNDPAGFDSVSVGEEVPAQFQYQMALAQSQRHLRQQRFKIHLQVSLLLRSLLLFHR